MPKLIAFSDILRQTIIDRANHHCEYCRVSQFAQEAAFHIDHILPTSAGGCRKDVVDVKGSLLSELGYAAIFAMMVSTIDDGLTKNIGKRNELRHGSSVRNASGEEKADRSIRRDLRLR